MLTISKAVVKDHIMGVLGGMIWGAGLVLSILSAGQAGFAISFGLGRGNAMIAAVWGVFVWKEFKLAPPGTNKLLYSMFLFYIHWACTDRVCKSLILLSGFEHWLLREEGPAVELFLFHIDLLLYIEVDFCNLCSHFL